MASLIVPDGSTPFAKQIAPVWETQGRTRRLVGFHARLNDDLLLVPGSETVARLFASYVDAEHALDEAALDLIDEAATTADLQALPFEPTAYEIAEMRAQSGCGASCDDPWCRTEVSTTYASTNDGETFRVTTIAPAQCSCSCEGVR